VPCKIQYCFAHILRDVEDLQEEFESQPGVLDFTTQLIPLLSTSQGLRGLAISNTEYYRRAKELKRQIMKLMAVSYDSLGVKNIQELFIEKEKRLFQWVKDRIVPCENNFAERQARIPVLARKVSFGSQSEQGAQTRGTLMTYLHTGRLRLGKDKVLPWIKDVLDHLAKDPKASLYQLLPPTARSHSP
jgi:hypothetical protein